MREGGTYKKLGEVGVVVTGSTPSTKDEANYASPDYCFVKPSDLPSKGIAVIDESEFHISSKAFSSARQLPKGSVVVSCIGIIGKVGILNKDACTNQQINAIIPNDTILPKCLAYIICNNKRELEQIANAPIVPIINKSEFSKFSIPVPPLSEQQSIVAELDKINELISLKKAQLSDLDALAQSIFYDMFGDPIENEKGWEVKKFGEVYKLKSGDGLSSKNFEDGPYSVFGGNGISGTHKTYNMDGEYIIIGRVGVYCGNVRYVKGKFWLTDNAFQLIYDKSKQIHIFIKHLLSIMDLHQYANQAAQPVISNITLKNVNVVFPPLSLQQDFAKRIELIEQQKAQISSTIKDLETLLASRMQYWFE